MPRAQRLNVSRFQQPTWIHCIDRAVAHVAAEVRVLGVKADRVLAGELAQLRVVVPGTVVVQVALGVRLAPGEGEDRVDRRVGLAPYRAKRVVGDVVGDRV